MKQPAMIILGALLCCTVSCQILSPKNRVYEGDGFSFAIPAGWKTSAEIWGKPIPPDTSFYGLGVNTAITIQYPPQKAKGKAFFSVATTPVGAGETLESYYQRAYENPDPPIEEVTEETIDLAGQTGLMITYKRPWGEPWWKFRDIWLEKDGAIYVLSFHSTPNSFDDYQETFDQIIESFSFKE